MNGRQEAEVLARQQQVRYVQATGDVRLRADVFEPLHRQSNSGRFNVAHLRAAKQVVDDLIRQAEATEPF